MRRHFSSAEGWGIASLHYRRSRKPTRYSNDSGILTALSNTLCPRGFVREYHCVYDAAGSCFRLDFAHPHLKLNVEYDGLAHLDDVSQASDIRRDKILNELGWSVMRVVSGQKSGAHNSTGWTIVDRPIAKPGIQFFLLGAILARSIAKYMKSKDFQAQQKSSK